MGENGYTHIFAFKPGQQPFTRLTNGPWHDITPAISPDGTKLVFASNRDGFYDLYLMDLATGEVTRLTATAAYDASPSWSPDGLWLVYESYVEESDGGGSLELFIKPVDASVEPIRLTTNEEADHSPNWSPQGRKIVFVSTRSGDSDIWLADLDAVDDRFTNLSHNKYAQENHPSWSPTGEYLTWSGISAEGIQDIYLFDMAQPDLQPQRLNSGNWSAWSPNGATLVTSIQTPNRDYLSGFSLSQHSLSLGALALDGPIAGMDWASSPFVGILTTNPPVSIAAAAMLTPTQPWQPLITPQGEKARLGLSRLYDVDAPDPRLADQVDESFNALRLRVARETGWDFLSNLEQAFIPLTSPLGPGQNEDWLYTGRSFSFNTAPVSAGWVKVIRQDHGPYTYWRIFLRARFQDGSQGVPLTTHPWDFTTRYSGTPQAYENGGALAPTIPSGYWIDFTRLAAAYGWHRLPALSSWRQAFSVAQYNKFAFTENLDWFSAMLQIYPRAALNTYTPVPSPTNTPTITNTPTKTPTLTNTPWLSRTPTPTRTPWPTRTPTITNTPRPSKTPTETPTSDPNFQP
jgi:TolB protein